MGLSRSLSRDDATSSSFSFLFSLFFFSSYFPLRLVRIKGEYSGIRVRFFPKSLKFTQLLDASN